MNEGHQEDGLGDTNAILDEAELKAIVDKETNKLLSETCMHVECNEKIFRHEDEERRVVYPQMDKFYAYFHGNKLEKDQMLYYFGHYLKGKNEKNYSYDSPVIMDIKIV